MNMQFFPFTIFISLLCKFNFVFVVKKTEQLQLRWWRFDAHADLTLTTWARRLRDQSTPRPVERGCETREQNFRRPTRISLAPWSVDLPKDRITAAASKSQPFTEVFRSRLKPKVSRRHHKKMSIPLPVVKLFTILIKTFSVNPVHQLRTFSMQVRKQLSIF